MSIYSHIDCQMIGISCGYINYMYLEVTVASFQSVWRYLRLTLLG